MSKLVWLSYPLNEETPLYGGGRGFSGRPDKAIAAGDSCNTSSFTLTSHTGTHIDAPRHFFAQGNPIDYYEAGFWVFENVCVVNLALTGASLIYGDQIIPQIKGEPELLLLRTGMWKLRDQETYWRDNPGLSPELGGHLRLYFPSIRAVGVDFISISSWRNRDLGREAHRSFLDPSKNKAILIIEDMDLSPLAGNVTVTKVIALPLRFAGGDGASCSVIAEVERSISQG